MNPNTLEYVSTECDPVTGNIKDDFTLAGEENLNTVVLSICPTCHDGRTKVLELLQKRIVSRTCARKALRTGSDMNFLFITVFAISDHHDHVSQQ